MPENDAYYYFHMLDKYFKKYDSSIKLERETHWWWADDLYIKIGEKRILIGKIKNSGIIWNLDERIQELQEKQLSNKVKTAIEKIKNVESKIENIFNNTERVLNNITQEKFDILMSHPKFRDKLKSDKNKTMIIQKQKIEDKNKNNNGINTNKNETETKFKYNLFFVNGEDGDDILNNNLQLNNNTNLYSYTHSNGFFKQFTFLNHLNWKQLNHNNSECIFIVPNNEASWGVRPNDSTIKNNAKRTATIIRKMLEKDNSRIKNNNSNNETKIISHQNNDNISTNDTNKQKEENLKIKKLHFEGLCYGNIHALKVVNYLTKARDMKYMNDETKNAKNKQYYQSNLEALKTRKIRLDMNAFGFNKLFSRSPDKVKNDVYKVLKNNEENENRVEVYFKNNLRDNGGNFCDIVTHNSEFNNKLMKDANERVNNNKVNIGKGKIYYKCHKQEWRTEQQGEGAMSQGINISSDRRIKLQGYFKKNGNFDGYGINSFANGNKYEGQFENSEFNGYGIQSFANGDKYEGQFKNDLFNGYGIETFISGSKYEGQFENGKYNGYGTYFFANGDKYEGQFENGKFKGYGIETFINGSKYEGQFKNDLFNGYGTFLLKSGDKYEGQFENGKYNGYGIYSYYLSEKKYTLKGFFNDDKQDLCILYDENNNPIQIISYDNNGNREAILNLERRENDLKIVEKNVSSDNFDKTKNKIDNIRQKDNIKNNSQAQKFIEKLTKIINNVREQNNIKTKEDIGNSLVIA